MKVLFWTLISLGAYVYVGYPLLLSLVGSLGARRRVARGENLPPVTLLVSAFNEERVIADKLRNALRLDYPRQLLQIIVISDASDDRTDEIVRGFAADGVELLRMKDRSGKTLGLNAAVRIARGDVVVFSDANAMYSPDVLRKLVRNFADPAVGAVVGESNYEDVSEASERNEGLYWKYETTIKVLESSIGSVVGGDGAIYAARRDCYVPMPADALSDFVNPLQVVARGLRCVYDPEARCFEKAAGDFSKEFRRKVRIVNRAWRATLYMRHLLNPFRYGFFSVQLISHKVLRWLMPLFMIGVAVSNLMLLGQGWFYAATAVAQVLFYGLAALGVVLRRGGSMPSVVSVPYYFCLVNVASARGILDAFRGKTYTTWTTPRASQS